MWIKNVKSFFYTTSKNTSWNNHVLSLERDYNFVPKGKHYWCIISGQSYFADDISDLLPITIDIDFSRFESVNFVFDRNTGINYPRKSDSNLRLTEIGCVDQWYGVDYDDLEQFFRDFKYTRDCL